ncbi:MAG: hypothetical protein ACREMG_00110, partial [Gemmatimonadales bacterium]
VVCAETATTVMLAENSTSVVVNQVFMIFLANGAWTVRMATGVASAPATGLCAAGNHAQITFAGGSPLNVAGGVCVANPVAAPACAAAFMISPLGRAVGYRIFYTAGVPSLERRTSDDWTWQPVLPGVEDLQVRYQDGTAAAFNNVPLNVTVAAAATPTLPELNALVRQVEVTLSARALAPGIEGGTTSAVGSAPRGRLVSVVAMRPVFETLSQPGPLPLPLFR